MLLSRYFCRKPVLLVSYLCPAWPAKLALLINRRREITKIPASKVTIVAMNMHTIHKTSGSWYLTVDDRSDDMYSPPYGAGFEIEAPLANRDFDWESFERVEDGVMPNASLKPKLYRLWSSAARAVCLDGTGHEAAAWTMRVRKGVGLIVYKQGRLKFSVHSEKLQHWHDTVLTLPL